MLNLIWLRENQRITEEDVRVQIGISHDFLYVY